MRLSTGGGCKGGKVPPFLSDSRHFTPENPEVQNNNNTSRTVTRSAKRLVLWLFTHLYPLRHPSTTYGGVQAIRDPPIRTSRILPSGLMTALCGGGIGSQ